MRFFEKGIEGLNSLLSLTIIIKPNLIGRAGAISIGKSL